MPSSMPWRRSAIRETGGGAFTWIVSPAVTSGGTMTSTWAPEGVVTLISWPTIAPSGRV